MSQHSRQNERGVALVTTLMIVAAMSVVAVTLSTAVLSSTNRAKSLDASTQADWLSYAAEEYARLVVNDVMIATAGALSDSIEGLNTPLTFEAEGGLITLTARDASNCFNLNSLTGHQASNDRTVGSAAQIHSPATDLLALIELAGLDTVDGEGLVASIVDWIDADQSPGLNGAEDSYYSSPTMNYRTSGQKLADVSELLSVRHFSADTLDAMEPFICALPEETQPPFNINTITEAQAPLLSLALSGALPVDRARDLVFQRPQGGWSSLDEFIGLPDVAEISPELIRADMLGRTSTYIDVRAAIEYRGTRRVFDLLFAVDEGRTLTVRRERKG
ncbi:type II secretion system minor pseudopilin GspK [Henriciella sp. AS95]|uniref:type II secretion system minor pseudopilin GspK n=1 Tax=Henriciella sp. AS95 TaxID=3135782 RepID=UPI00317071AE